MRILYKFITSQEEAETECEADITTAKVAIHNWIQSCNKAEGWSLKAEA